MFEEVVWQEPQTGLDYQTRTARQFQYSVPGLEANAELFGPQAVIHFGPGHRIGASGEVNSWGRGFVFVQRLSRCLSSSVQLLFSVPQQEHNPGFNS